MQHKFVTFTTSASTAPVSAHCTVRVRDAKNHQIGDKMRTHKLDRKSTGWDEVMLVPVACPELPLDIRLEVNIRGPAWIYTEQLGQAFFFLDTLGLGVQSSNIKNLNIQLNSTWCRDKDCLQRFVNETNPKRQPIRHKGLDCGSGCHNALAALTRNIVSKARVYLEDAVADYYRDKYNEKYSRAVGGDEGSLSDEQQKALLDSMEQYWDDRPDDKSRKKKQAWEKLIKMLGMIPFIAKKACGDHQPLLPWVQGSLGKITLKTSSQIFHEMTSTYLTNMEEQLEKAATELRRLWFEEKVYALKAVDEKCPTSHSLLQDAAQP